MKEILDVMLKNGLTTSAGLVQSLALCYVGYKTAQPELMIAGVAALFGGAASKDIKKEELPK